MKYFLLLIVFLIFSCNKLSNHEWELIGVKDIERMQFHTDSINYVESKRIYTTEEIRLGMAPPVKKTFVKSGPVDLNLLKIKIDFDISPYPNREFSDFNTVSIDEGCNTISGIYNIEGNCIKFDSLITTLVNCLLEERLEHKGTIMSYLLSTYKFDLPSDDTLILFSKYNNALIFKKVK